MLNSLQNSIARDGNFLQRTFSEKNTGDGNPIIGFNLIAKYTGQTPRIIRRLFNSNEPRGMYAFWKTYEQALNRIYDLQTLANQESIMPFGRN